VSDDRRGSFESVKQEDVGMPSQQVESRSPSECRCELEALTMLLDTDAKRRRATQLVLAWHIAKATGLTCDSLLELTELADRLFLSGTGHEGAAYELIAIARCATVLAFEVGKATEEPNLRELCFSLATRCKADAVRIQRALLWAEQG
jgi:hypothetical protein